MKKIELLNLLEELDFLKDEYYVLSDDSFLLFGNILCIFVILYTFFL